MDHSILKSFEIEEAYIRLREDGIILIEYKSGTEINVDLQNRLYEMFSEICKDGDRPFLFKAMDKCTVTPEAKQNAIAKEAIFPGSATAVVADNLAYKIIANFYLKIKKPKKPFKVFGDEESAIEWLKEFL